MAEIEAIQLISIKYINYMIEQSRMKQKKQSLFLMIIFGY